MDRIFRLLQLFAKHARRRPKCIHCEAIFDDGVFDSVKEFVSNHKITFFCITPANRDFIQGNFGPVDDRLEEKLHERYQWLAKNGIDLQLHVHTSLLSGSDLAFQKRLIKAAKDWMNRWGFAPSDVALGWFKRDPETESIVREVGLRLAKEGDYFFLHDYEIARYLRGDIDWQ